MRPQFSVVSPMFNVERYLPDFLASLQRQSYGFDRIQVILVDDGSHDGTLELARGFARLHPNVTVLSKPNGGQASARNLGLASVEGEWVTFPDPDDVLSDDYFTRVAHAIAQPAAAEAAVISCRLLMWYEDIDEIRDTHALGGRFRDGEKIVDLDHDPEWIQPHITSGFIRTEIVRSAAITFPEELRLRFEDGNFIARYLLHCPRPVVVFVPDADYHYRQRADASSTIQSSFADPRKYTDTIRYGFRGVIDEAKALGRALPRWTQNLFLYDQFWILRSSQTAAVRQAAYPPEMYDELDVLIPEYLQYVDAEAIRTFNLMPVTPWMRDALLLVKAGGGHSTVYVGADDANRGLESLVYRYVGNPPAETVLADGRVIEPVFTKVQELEYVGKPIAWQRTLWVPDDADIVVQLDGAKVHVAERPDKIVRAFTRRSRARRSAQLLRRAKKAIGRRMQGQFTSLLRRDVAVRSPGLKRKFANAWVFIDREADANDSAEDLYWWVATNHPEINAWFVVREGTADWERLRRRGARLVAYGSPEFFALLVHADHLASSHADRFITDALPRKLRAAADYTFTFLQHGVIKGDLSLWLNGKAIGVFVTSTEDEYDYITGTSPYRFGAKEVRLTGLPRFDALLERAAQREGDGRDIVIMPTWRNYLVSSMGSGADDREQMHSLAETKYGAAIHELLHDERLLALKREHGMRLIFMPHPNMRPYLAEFDVPGEIEVFSYEDQDVREVVVGAKVLVTDYSSIAFNAAYLQRAIVYYQFDQEEYAAGHTERAGYFSYESHGFGPVATTSGDAVEQIVRAWTEGAAPQFVERMSATFPVRDGRNSERVFAAMLEARTVHSIGERSVAAAPDRWTTVGPLSAVSPEDLRSAG